MPEHRTACPLDCPDACTLTVRVEEGRVVSLDGNEVNPVTAGFICGKVRRFADHLYGDARIRRPAVRVGPKGAGEFEPVSWDEALGRVAERLLAVRDASGGEAILPWAYGGSNGVLSDGSADARLFARLGASQLERTICAAPTGEAARGIYGKVPGTALTDYVHARLIVVWGFNPHSSGIHLVPIINEARSRGAKLVVVDPRRTKLAAAADLHLAPRPGTDLPVALAVIRSLFEDGGADERFLAEHATGADELRRRAAPWTPARAAEVSGVPAGAIDRLARLWAETSPAVVRCGWGLERNRNGGSAAAAVLCLPAVAGKLGVRGGGYTMSNSGAWTFDARALGASGPPARSVSMNQVGRALTELRDPRVELLFVYNGNPLATAPDQERTRRGLLREDLFTVVFEQVMTDTARHADVVLPATTFLEHDDLARGYGSLVLNRIRPVIAPVGEARSNVEVFGELLRRTGLAREGEPDTPDAIADAIVATSPRAGAIARDLAERGTAFPEPAAGVLFVDFPPATAGGKVHLVPEALDREAPGGLYAYHEDPGTARHPIALISPATELTISSTFGQLVKHQVPVTIHPDDAAARGVATGDVVRVFNDLGEVICEARVSDEVRPGVASLPKGLWAHSTRNGATANALCPDTLTDIGRGACFNDARVQIERA